MDDDLQNPPEEIPRLLDQLDAGFDVVYGSPTQGAHGVLRNLASFITKLALQNAMGAATARQVSAFRAFRTHLRDAFNEYRGPHVSIDVLLTWGSNRFTSIPVRCDPRTVGTSNYTLSKLVAHALNMMTGFTTLPLQAASLLGFFCTLLGAGLLVYVLAVRVIYGGVVHGFTFLASVITIFSGAQLFALGVFGEYLARIHFRLMDRPAYTIHGVARGETVDQIPG
jgi:undecaprenyl-phosphate 4-deoxy-4-formamido-L-arabinose transferase